MIQLSHNDCLLCGKSSMDCVCGSPQNRGSVFWHDRCRILAEEVERLRRLVADRDGIIRRQIETIASLTADRLALADEVARLR